MGYQLKKSYVTMVTTIIGFVIFLLYILRETDVQTFTKEDLGKYLLLVVPVLIVIDMIGKFIFNLLDVNKDKDKKRDQMDEFDTIIEYKSVRNFGIAFMLGFFISCLLFLVSTYIFYPFLALFITLHVSGLVLQVSYIKYYEYGV
jgi:lipoprotein signal peptidase